MLATLQCGCLREADQQKAVATSASAPASGNALPASVHKALLEAENWELYSLDPNFDYEEAPDRFQGWKVLGKTTVKDPSSREPLLTALVKGIGENRDTKSGCFWPRHGIRVVQGDKTIDLAICFQCMYLHIHGIDGAEGRQGLCTSRSPEPVFDSVLKKAGMSLAEKTMPE